MSQLVLPGMRRQGRGRIINVGSIGGRLPHRAQEPIMLASGRLKHLLTHSVTRYKHLGSR